jgi:hypothetical protein
MVGGVELTMPDAISYRDPLLINTLGHSVGVLVFGVLVMLLVRDRRHRSGAAQTRLPIIAGLLAFLWNFGAASGRRQTM